MPAIGLVFDEPDFDNLLTFGGVDAQGVPVGSFGAVLTALLNFFIVAVVLFLIIRVYNRSRRPEGVGPEAEAGAEPGAQLDPEEVVLLREIRDLLRAAGHDSDTPGPPNGGPGSTAP